MAKRTKQEIDDLIESITRNTIPNVPDYGALIQRPCEKPAVSENLDQLLGSASTVKKPKPVKNITLPDDETNVKTGQRVLDVFGGKSSAQKQVDKYNRAANQRLAAVLAMYDQMGQAQNMAIDRQVRQGGAMAVQSLRNRGLGNTTILDAIQQRIAESAGFQRQALGERVAATKAGVLERVNDAPPPISAYLDEVRRLNAARATR